MKWTALPEDLEKKRKMITHHHNRLIFLFVLIGGAMLLVLLFSADHFLKSQPLHTKQSFVWMVAVFITLVSFGFYILLKRSDANQCRKIGFVCPICKAPLFVVAARDTRWGKLASSHCPKCNHLLT